MSRLDVEDRADEAPPSMPEDASLQAALVDMQDVKFCNSEKWHEQQWRANRDNVPLDLLDFESRFVNRARNMYRIPLYCHTAKRSLEEQAKLVAAGRSHSMRGPHTYGFALDIVHSTKAWNLSKNQWALLGHIGKDVARNCHMKLDWGGDWRFYDPAHWEIAHWKLRVKR